MDSITILSDDAAGIESLIKLTNFTSVPAPGLSGNGIEVIKKIRNTFGSHITIKQLMGILKDHPELVTELNMIDKFQVNHA